MLCSIILGVLFFSIQKQDSAQIDSAGAVAYVKTLLELLPDTILILGKVSAFGWDEDSNFIRGDSDITVTFEHNGTYYSIETARDGLFYFDIERSDSTFGLEYISVEGFTMGGSAFPTGAMGFTVHSDAGLAYASGSVRIHTGDVDISTEPDSLWQWGYRFSEDMTGILADFCALYPNHEFAPRARVLLNQMGIKRTCGSLIAEDRFNAARDLLAAAYEASPESEYLMLSLVEIHVDRAQEFAAAGDTVQALRILRNCAQLGDTKGLHGGLLKLYLLVAIASGSYHAPLDSNEKTCDFSEQIIHEIDSDIIAPFIK